MLYIPFGQLLVRGKKRRNLSMMVRLKRLFKEVPDLFSHSKIVVLLILNVRL